MRYNKRWNRIFVPLYSLWFKVKWYPLCQLQVWEFVDDQFSCFDQSDEVWGTQEWTEWNGCGLTRYNRVKYIIIIMPPM